MMYAIPAGRLTDAEVHVANIEGLTVGLLVGIFVVLLGLLFLIVKMNAEIQTIRKLLGIETIRATRGIR